MEQVLVFANLRKRVGFWGAQVLKSRGRDSSRRVRGGSRESLEECLILPGFPAWCDLDISIGGFAGFERRKAQHSTVGTQDS